MLFRITESVWIPSWIGEPSSWRLGGAEGSVPDNLRLFNIVVLVLWIPRGTVPENLGLLDKSKNRSLSLTMLSVPDR